MILDFSKKREMEFKFYRPSDGKLCVYDGVIDAKTLDRFNEISDKNKDEAMKNIKFKPNADMSKLKKDTPVGEALEYIELESITDIFTEDKELESALISVFLGDREKEFNEDTVGIEYSARHALHKAILNEVNELSTLIEDKDIEKK